MNAILKRLMLSFLSLFMVLSVTCAMPEKAKAEDYEVLSLNDTYKGEIHGDATIMKIELKNAGILGFTMKSYAETSYYYLYDENFNKIWYDNVYENSTLGFSSYSPTSWLNKGIYYLVFKSFREDSDIEIKTSFETVKDTFAEPTYGDNNDATVADSISANKKYYGFLNSIDDKDVYKFSLSSKEKITFKFNFYFKSYAEYSTECKIYLYDNDGNCIGLDDYWDYLSVDADKTGVFKQQINMELSKGTYYLCMIRSGNSAEYNFTIVKEIKKFYVKYYSNNGTGSMNKTTVEYGKDTKLRDNAFKRTGYQFNGWTMYRESDKKWLYTDGTTNKWYKEGNQPSGYKKKVYKDEAKVSKLSSKKNDVIRAYAVWKNNTFTIEYLKNGGKGTMSNTTVTYGKSKALRANAYTRSGYKFVGWTAKRKSDGKWYYTNGTKTGWYKEGNQPSGYKKAVYDNKQKISKTTSKNKDVVYMVARWEKK